MSLETEIAETIRAELAPIIDHLARLSTPVQPKAYRIPEAAAALGVGRDVVYHLIASGDLPTVVLPSMTERRIPAAAVDALVAPERWSRPALVAVPA